MSKRRLPQHIPGTYRAWQKRKRQQWAKLKSALLLFSSGCAYTPSYVNVYLRDQNGKFVVKNGRHVSRIPYLDLAAVVDEISELMKRWK